MVSEIKGRLLPEGEIPSLGLYVTQGSNIEAMSNFYVSMFAEKGTHTVATGDNMAEMDKKKIG